MKNCQEFSQHGRGVVCLHWPTFFFQADFNEKDTYYVFNHVDIVIQYHSGQGEEWGQSIGEGGRLVSAKLEPRR